MRDRMERLVILPFSVGCMSEASVAVGIPQPIRRSSRQGINSSPIRSKGDEESANLSGESMKNSLRFHDIPKSSNISTGINKLFKGFKNLSQLFGEKEEDLEEVEMEMEIGCPTDVQHVTHIGWDGNASSDPIKGWDHLIPPELLSFSSFSFPAIAKAQTQTPSLLLENKPSPSP
ncbi:hypothetical protein L6164_035264 [Bauhinia variegata]|uniref:Uncharacterized protein n=1 Tax=Bauhinia variegata TaxID=167791 RepID=A0ACB9KXX1_BAUVA|nr:hypothetical protein L6164_035264 [Bauhinia variegata]